MSGQVTAFPGPTPPYTNPPIEPENFQPSRFVISAITRGPTTVVTTSTDHNYVIGQLTRIILQPYSGAYALNGQLSYVIAIPSSTEVTLDLNSKNADPFIPSPTFAPTPPQIVAIGDENSGVISSTGRSVPTTTIAGSFQNISP